MHNEDAVLRHLRSAFKRARKGGRLYYSAGDCNDNYVPFEKVRIDESVRHSADLATVKRMFAPDARVRVTETEGIVRIYVGDVPKSLLQTKVSHFSFDLDAQYTPEEAMIALVYSPAIDAAAKRLGLHQPDGAIEDVIVEPPLPARPHLPTVLQDVTLDQALDAVADTFDGIVEFGVCKNGPIWEANFAGGLDFDEEFDKSPNDSN
ncbi:MAG TPA: hypothetical protein VMF58_10580 [Rhizomicrobium sp.]|nr:hypothetical protein [Rhizomicrobium sp.]